MYYYSTDVVKNELFRLDLRQKPHMKSTNIKNGSESTYLRYEDKANGQSGGEEGEKRGECVDGVYLVFDHERRRNADQAQNDHVVHANTCNSIASFLRELRLHLHCISYNETVLACSDCR